MFRTILLAGFAFLVLSQSAPAQSQSYGKWSRASDGRYYCEYYYKSVPTAKANNRPRADGHGLLAVSAKAAIGAVFHSL